MPDISMCPGGACPIKATCYRHMAKPSEFRQSYLVTPPYSFDTGECECYWPLSPLGKKCAMDSSSDALSGVASGR